MNSVDFCFWLQGHFELSETDELTEQQVQTIKKHLHLVFKHEIDPARDKGDKTVAQALNNIHGNDMQVRC